MVREGLVEGDRVVGSKDGWFKVSLLELDPDNKGISKFRREGEAPIFQNEQKTWDKYHDGKINNRKRTIPFMVACWAFVSEVNTE